MLNIAYGAEEITAGPHEGEILIADRYQVLIVNRRLNCVFRHGSKNTIDIADGTQGFATFNHELGEEGRILWSMREGDRIQEIDVATGDVTLDWSINGPTATYEFAGGEGPRTLPSRETSSSPRDTTTGVRKYDRDQNVIEEVSVPSPDHATEIRRERAEDFHRPQGRGSLDGCRLERSGFRRCMAYNLIRQLVRRRTIHHDGIDHKGSGRHPRRDDCPHPVPLREEAHPQPRG